MKAGGAAFQQASNSSASSVARSEALTFYRVTVMERRDTGIYASLRPGVTESTKNPTIFISYVSSPCLSHETDPQSPEVISGCKGW